MISTDYTVLTLESVLDDQSSDLFQAFSAYLHQSYCIENLEFWLAVQRFQLCIDDQIARECELIVSIYIRPNSPQEINIPCEMRQSILENYTKQNYIYNMFDKAAESVLELMRINSFLPWIMLISAPSPSQASFSPSSYSSQCSTPTTPYDTQTVWPVSPIYSNTTSNSSNSTSSSSKYHRPTAHTNSSKSVTTISSSFSFSDKWQVIKLKQLSRRSCSSIDYSSSDFNNEDGNNHNDKTEPLTPSESLAESFSSASSAPTTCPRYKTMLKRVKQSLLGHSSEASPRSSISDITWSHWKK